MATSMRRHDVRSLLLAIALIVVSAVAAGASPGTDGSLAITTIERPWLLESEFAADPSLHATADQVIVLDLESGQGGQGVFRENTIRFLLKKARRLALCIPAKEPYIVRLRLERNRPTQPGRRPRGQTVLTRHRGGPCKPVQLSAGSYTLRVFHDPRSVPPAGKLAFVHRPRARTDVLGASASPASLAFMVFKGPNGQYVSTTSGGRLATNDTSVDASSVWQIVDGPSPFGLEDGTGNRVNLMPLTDEYECSNYLYIGSANGGPYCPDIKAQFTMKGSPDQFGLWAVGVDYTDNEDLPIIVDGGILVYNDTYTTPAMMSADYQGFRCANDSCAGDALVLQKGEVALFSKCNFKGPAVVFRADVPDLSIYDAAGALGLGIGDNMTASLRVGPDTLAVLYRDAAFGGPSLGAAADIACLDDGTALGSNQASSLKLIPGAVEYILSTNACVNCDLAGIDLAGADLAGGTFTGTNFTDANLAATRFPFAGLSDATFALAQLDGADFTGADLRCADLSGTDLTAATLGRGKAVPVVSDYDVGAIFSVEAGQRTILSGAGTGSGPSLDLVDGVADAEDGTLLVTAGASVLRVAASGNGDRTTVSGPNVGSGPAFIIPGGIAVDADGSLLVIDAVRGLFRVDPVSGDRTIVSGSRTGSGPSLVGLFGIALDADGTVLVAAGLPGILRVDPATGDRTLVSGGGRGIGPAFELPWDIAIAGDGSLLVSDLQQKAVLRVDPATGDRTLVSGMGVGSGPALVLPEGITLTGSGTLLVTDVGVLLAIDPASGDRRIVSGPGVGDGPDFINPHDVALFDPSPTVVPDRSCRLDVSHATLDLTTFPLTYWRDLDLTGATINGAAGATLSTLDAPLDLSGAKLSGVNLSGATLDGVNLGCYPSIPDQTTVCPAPNGTKVCAELQGTNLTDASLKHACLSSASMGGASLSYSNLDGADMSGVLLQPPPGGKVAHLNGAFMRNVTLTGGANLTGVEAQNVDFYTAQAGSADASGLTAPGANFTGAYLASADFSGAQSNLQSTNWTNAMLLGANFSQADLSTNTSGGVNSGTNTTFEGAYLQGAQFASAILDDVNFLNTYWDALGAGGNLNLLIPQQNLLFTGYWKDSRPECPPALQWSGNLPPMSTDMSNTCPNGGSGPCDAVWGDPKVDIDLAFFQSAYPGYPFDPSVTDPSLQCGGANNSVDYCWTTTSEPPPAKCVAN